MYIAYTYTVNRLPNMETKSFNHYTIIYTHIKNIYNWWLYTTQDVISNYFSPISINRTKLNSNSHNLLKIIEMKFINVKVSILRAKWYLFFFFFFFVLRFYGPDNPMESCRAWSVYLTTRLLGRLSPLSGYPVLCTFFHQKLTTALLESAEGKEWP